MDKVTGSSSPLSPLKRHSWVALATFPSVTFGATLLSLSVSPRLYETSARLSVGEKDVGVSSLGQALTDSKIQAPGRAADPVAIQAERVESAKVIQRAIDIFARQSRLSPEELPTVEEVQSAMKVKIVPATNILQVSLQSPEPQVASRLLNAIIQAAIDENVEANRSEASSLRKFLEAELPKQLQKVKQTEAAERQYRQMNGIVSLERQMESVVTSVAALEDEERKLRAQLQEGQIKRGLLQQVTGLDSPRSAYQAVRIGQNDNLKELEKQLTNVEVAITEARSRLGDQHPDLLALMQKQGELKAVYSRELASASSTGDAPARDAIAANAMSQDLASRYIVGEIENRAAAGKLQIVQAELAQLRSRSISLPAHQQVLSALTRERESAETSLKALSAKLEEARMAEGQVLSNTRILQRASEPSEPMSPQPLAILVISAIAGLILSGALVLLLEMLDPSLRTAAEAEAALEVPVLGHLPKMNPPTATLSDLERLVHHPNRVEPYRMLLKTLASFRERNSQVLVFSDVARGAGKASVILHLATTAALLSRRTLVIDADLRHPVFHELFNFPAYPGLTDVVGERVPLMDAVQSTPIENLFVLPCGRSPYWSSTFIETASMAKLLSFVAGQYDYVLVNASALETCADAVTLSQSSDGLVLVIKAHGTPKDIALKTIAELQRSNLSPLGIVMNETVLPIETSAPVLPPPMDQLHRPLALQSVSQAGS